YRVLGRRLQLAGGQLAEDGRAQIDTDSDRPAAVIQLLVDILHGSGGRLVEARSPGVGLADRQIGEEAQGRGVVGRLRLALRGADRGEIQVVDSGEAQRGREVDGLT